MNNTTYDYIEALKRDRPTLVEILNEKGVEASESETFTTLVEKVREIGGGSTPTTVTVDISSQMPEWPNSISYIDVAIDENISLRLNAHMSAGNIGFETIDIISNNKALSAITINGVYNGWSHHTTVTNESILANQTKQVSNEAYPSFIGFRHAEDTYSLTVTYSIYE